MKKNFTVQPKNQIKAATDYKLIDKLVKDYEDDYVRGKALSVIWNEIIKKHHDAKLARDVVAELEKTNKKVDYYDEDAERDPNFIKDRKNMKDIKSGCHGKKKEKVEASDGDDDEDGYDKGGYCKKCGRKLTDQGECLVCEGKVAEEDFDDEVEGCNVMSAMLPLDLGSLSGQAELIADYLETWIEDYMQSSDAFGHLSGSDIDTLDDAADILRFAAQSLKGSDEIL